VHVAKGGDDIRDASRRDGPLAGIASWARQPRRDAQDDLTARVVELVPGGE
jgi:hypothetical protein